ncbi:MAG: hypothetical protein ABIP20_07640 [Chthoniobacteraceae bacterium]
MNPRPILVATVLLGGLAFTFTSSAEPPEKKPVAASRDVTAAEVNGTWKCGRDTFKILALGGGKLQVDFDGVFEYKSANGLMANIGQGAGVANIEGDMAIFVPYGTAADGKITLKFSGGKLIVAQEGDCGFGHRVRADGTYRKISSKKPVFEK